MESWVFLLGFAAISFGAGLLTSIVWQRPRNWRRCWLAYVVCVIAAWSLMPFFNGDGSIAFGDIYALVAAMAVAALLLGTQLGDQIVIGGRRNTIHEGDG